MSPWLDDAVAAVRLTEATAVAARHPQALTVSGLEDRLIVARQAAAELHEELESLASAESAELLGRLWGELRASVERRRRAMPTG